MMSKKEALELIQDNSNSAHSILTGTIMRILADMLQYENIADWELTGILHDLDIDLVRQDMSEHGLLAAEMLKGRIPEYCVNAIKSHDFRTGVKPITLTDKTLIFADAISHVYGEHELLSVEVINLVSKSKPWLGEIILDFSSEHLVHLHQLETLIRTTR